MRAARHRWLWVAAVAFCTGWGGNQFTPLLSVYRDRMGYTQVDVDLLLGAYVVGLIPGLLVAAACSDHFGRRPVLIVGALSSVVSSLLLSTGDTLGMAALAAGRALTGVAVGIAMAVGTSWITELSSPRFDPRLAAGTGARRAAISLTLGFAAGPAAAGLLAQWGPAPLVFPFVLQAVLAAGALTGLVAFGVETRRPDRRLRLRSRLRVPTVAHRRFVWVIVPMAPWIFGSAGVAYAIVPQVVGPELGRWKLLYATALTVATLIAGVLVQPIARRLDSASTARAVFVSMLLMTCGVAAAAATAATHSPWLGAPVALLLGAAYGIAVVSGLLEIQRFARPDDLAGITGVYYALAYVGFLLPALLAAIAPWIVYTWALVALTLVALGCSGVVLSAYRRHLPLPGVAPVVSSESVAA